VRAARERFLSGCIRAILALALCAGASAAPAHPAALKLQPGEGRVPASASLLVLEDPSLKLGIEDIVHPVNAARFQPATPDPDTGALNYSFSKSAWWLALPVTLDAAAPNRWLLEVAYSSLDCVEVFTRRADGSFERQVSGDMKKFSQRPYPHRNLVFPLALWPGETQTIYLRVTTEGTVTLPVTLWQPEALAADDQVEYTLLSLYYGMLLALGLYNLLLFSSTREPTFLAYVAFTVAMAIGQLSLNGFGNQFLWGEYPRWGDLALPLGMALTGLTGSIFVQLFLDTRRTSPYDGLLRASVGLFVIAILLALYLPYRPLAIFVSLLGVVFSVVAVMTGIHSVRAGHPGGRYYLLAWTALLLGVAIQGLRVFGLVPTTGFTLHAMQIGSALELLLLSFALADRINVMRAQKEAADAAALHANNQLVETLRRSEQELERRVAERTGALETAHNLLLDKERELRRLALQDPLTGVANRLFLNDRIDRAISRARRSGDHVALLMIDLDNFKPINDRHGHAVGDQLLVAIAGRIRAMVRETDTLARIGGDEFVLLMEDVREPDGIRSTVEKLMETVRKPIMLDSGESVSVSASIGVAFAPMHAEQTARLLDRADVEMYKAKAGGRNRYSIAA
jgi:diguanylate cyclase (GGDEF)-like protein